MNLHATAAKPFPLRPHPHLYEINTWPWLERLSTQLGRVVKLGDVPDAEWDSLAQMGFDIVWLMGVWKRSDKSREIALTDPASRQLYDRVLPGWKPSDVVGSPYSVAGYEPDPRMGTWDDLDLAREKLRARGIALFLDFVGNHTALDHPWTREHPEFYVQGTEKDFENDPGSFHAVHTEKGTVFLALGRDPYFPSWKDAAQLNHFQPQMRAAQLADLRTIAAHCDGVRCDMAMLHLKDIFAGIWGRFLHGTEPPETEFWTDAHAAAPSLILLAEAYWGTEPRLLELGFSFVYDKELYDAIRDIRVEEVHTLLGANISTLSRYAKFLENHDEAPCLDVFGERRLASVATLMGTLPGLRFYYQAEVQGCEPHLPITLGVPPKSPPNPMCLTFFPNILNITNDDVFHRGRWKALATRAERDNTSVNLVIYEWHLEKAWKIVAVNLADTPSQAYVQFEESALSGEGYIFYDEMHDVRYPRTSDELKKLGLFVRLDAYQAHLFDVTSA